jgi:hypothetical protein
MLKVMAWNINFPQHQQIMELSSGDSFAERYTNIQVPS